MSTGERQHYLPATLLGGFGMARGDRLREAELRWRRRNSGIVLATKAESIGWRSRMYRLANPAPGVDPDVVDTVWDTIEPYLHQLVSELEAGSTDPVIQQAFLVYAAMVGVRHPDFGDALNRWYAEAGQPAISGDAVQMARLKVMSNGLQTLLPSMRWRFLHSPSDAPRFTISDRGWTYIGQHNRPGRGLYIPLNSRVAAVGWEGPAGGFDHQVLRPNYVRWLNAAIWTDASEFVAGHPESEAELQTQRTAREVSHRITLVNGAFRDIPGRRYLFDEI
ncbi:DUF4238 domain-containing protein [Streptomyces sp. NPDC052036]|uniref:DUF4238 domain-containing protein n=1 Tax=Streptomyces sp. NPDC052036 TaxID=3155171 RepID=UPI00342F2BE5